MLWIINVKVSDLDNLIFGLYFTACYKQTEAFCAFRNDASDGNQYLCAHCNGSDGNQWRLPTAKLYCQQCDCRRWNNPPPTDYKNVQASWDWLRFLYIVKRTVNASKSKDKNLTTCPNKIIIRICNRSYFIFQRNQELLWGGHSGEVGFALLIPLHHHLQHHRGRHHLSSVSVHWGPHQTEVAKPHFLHKFGSHGCFRYRLRQS